MTDYLIPPPDSRILPVTLGADAAFSVRRTDDNGDPVPFDGEVYLQVDLDKANPTKVQASVNGSLASIRLDYLLADLCRNSTKWQVIMKTGSAETALLVGRFERRDG